MNARTFVFVLLAAVVPVSPAAAAAPPRGGDLARFSEAIQDLSARVAPAVVEIVSTGYGPLAPERDGTLARQRATGSGVLLTADGFIVTNAHVVTEARSITVILAVPRAGRPMQSILKPSGRPMHARVIGLDSETDLAVLKIDGHDLPFLELGDSDDIRQGQLVLALGSPLGLENSVTMGVVSGVARQLRPEDRMVYVQTDAPINPGNSGGPLLDMDGRVIGINTLIFSQSGGAEGIGFAAPSNIVRYVFEEIRSTGTVRRGHIGALAQTITPVLAEALGLAQDWGVILGDVAPDGPADRAGLEPGDVVVTLDGKPMENGRQFDVNLYRRRVGDVVRLDVARAGLRRTVQVEVVQRPEDPGRFMHMVSRERNRVDPLGILAVEITPEVAKMVPWLRDPHGVVVASSAPDAPMGSDGPLMPGDVIQAVNGRPVATLDALRGAVDALTGSAAVALHINRRGQMMFLGLRLEAE
jgi:serine protease Do